MALPAPEGTSPEGDSPSITGLPDLSLNVVIAIPKRNRNGSDNGRPQPRTDQPSRCLCTGTRPGRANHAPFPRCHVQRTSCCLQVCVHLIDCIGEGFCCDLQGGTEGAALRYAGGVELG